MTGVGSDSVAAGLVESLARPGGNVTGLTVLGVQLSGKRLELLKEVMPPSSHVAVLWDAANPGNRVHIQEAETAARGPSPPTYPLSSR
jgi:putative ABC transport system substrate-binding protein